MSKKEHVKHLWLGSRGVIKLPHQVGFEVVELGMIVATCTCGYASRPADQDRVSLAANAHLLAMRIARPAGVGRVAGRVSYRSVYRA